MTDALDSHRRPSIYVGVGIGKYDHRDQYPGLEKAVADVVQISRILEGFGYEIHVLADPDRSVGDMLDDLLGKDLLRDGGNLIIVWSGHGEPAGDGGLNLIAKNTKPGSAALITPKYLADLAARTGANQILLILDTCYSGGGVVPAVDMAHAVWRDMPPDRKHRVGFVAIASAMDYERAKDGVFGSHLIKLLKDGPDDPKLRRQQWSPRNVSVQTGDFIKALMTEWDDSLMPVQFGFPALEFPNPLYRPVSPGQMDLHLRNAARGVEPGEDGFYFAGRNAQINRIVAWMRDRKPGVLAVTGPPGIGKSALLGRIVSLSNAEERANILTRGALDHADPGELSVAAHVHALRYNAERLVAAIDEQLVQNGILPAADQSRTGRGELQGAIQQSGQCPVIVVDGLHEAGSEVWRIAENVLRTLSEVCLVLVGTQALPAADGPLPLIEAVGAKEVIDLGDPAIRKDSEADLSMYIGKRLSDVPASVDDITAVCDLIRDINHEIKTGDFLLARYMTSQIRYAKIDVSGPGWQELFRRSFEETAEKYIAGLPPLKRGGTEIPQAARELFEALVWAKGPGLPDDIWPVIATALSPEQTAYERPDVFWLLDQVKRYIVEDGQGGRAVYRFVHQQLSDYVRSTSLSISASASQDEKAARIAQALVKHYQVLLATGKRPQDAAYLWRYIWQHCADAGEPGIAALRQLCEKNKTAFAVHLARALSALSRKETQQMRWREAVRMAGEATAIYRQFQTDPSVKTDMAEALTALGLLQTVMGQTKEGLASTKEAVEIFKTMEIDNPAIAPLYARALTVLGTGYFMSGQLMATIEPARDAEAVLRKLNGDTLGFRPELADALSMLGISRLTTGRPQEGLTAAEEAVSLFKTMDAKSPAVNFQLANALSFLGMGYCISGRLREAAAAAEEADAVFRSLDMTHPIVRFQSGTALTVLGISYSQMGHHERALSVAKEAVRLFAKMDNANQTIGSQLAWALAALGSVYAQTGQWRRALDVSRKAVKIIESLDTVNPIVSAWPMTVLSRAYLQQGRLEEGIVAAEKAARLLKDTGNDNPIVGALLADALYILGLIYLQTGLPDKSLINAAEAVRILEDMDAGGKPEVKMQYVLALNLLSDFYIRQGSTRTGGDIAMKAVRIAKSMNLSPPGNRLAFSEALLKLSAIHFRKQEPKKGVAAAGKAADLLKIEQKTNPLFRMQFGRILIIVSEGYGAISRPQKASEAANEAVDLFGKMDVDDPDVKFHLGGALSALGMSRLTAGRAQDGLSPIKEAVSLFLSMNTSVPDVLGALVAALAKLTAIYGAAGLTAEIDTQWAAALDSLKPPADKAFLLLRWVELHEASDTSAVEKLIRAQAFLKDEDRERIADLHRVCRSRRLFDPAGFDEAWRRQSGENPPPWLTLDDFHLSTLLRWIDEISLDASRDRLRESITALKSEASFAALDEIALGLPDPTGLLRHRNLLKRAFDAGVDEAYRPEYASRLLSDWMASDFAATRRMLQERRNALLDDDIREALRMRLTEKPHDPELIVHGALLDLARIDKEELAFRALDDPARAPAVLSDLAHGEDFAALHAVSTILSFCDQTDSAKALAFFYKAVALFLTRQPEQAFDAVVHARRLDPSRVANWLVVLIDLAGKHDMTALSQALIAPLPLETAGD